MIHRYPTRPVHVKQAFTDPFRYSPHPMVQTAAELIIDRIRNSSELSDMFSEGKMLGVLVVSYGPDFEQIGYLAGFSGIAAGKSIVEGFVPPIFDLTDPNGYFKLRESEITALNLELSRMSASPELIELHQQLAQAISEMQVEVSEQKARMAALKTERDRIRDGSADISVKEELIRQSQFEKAQLRRLKSAWEERVTLLKSQIECIEDRIDALKRQRKEMSDQLQDWIFHQYRVHNSRGEELSIYDIFEAKGLVPPGGTGECAAPKLLEYAYRNGLKPLAMGEFWYGESPSTAVRTEGRFYPSCTSKCGPLLGFMLDGLELHKESTIHGKPEIQYEDKDILAVRKPSGMPSVPGLARVESLLEWLVAKTGCTTIESVHRLDMDTSGIMIFAKHSDAGSKIRKQFELHSVRKTYKARLSPGGKHMEIGEEGVISIPLSPDYDERPRQKVDSRQGKEAVTGYHVDDILADGSIIITFRPETGRTHQLRVHSAHHLGLGHPIMGDLLYGGSVASRLHLHAEEIRFIHPSSGEEITFNTSWDPLTF